MNTGHDWQDAFIYGHGDGRWPEQVQRCALCKAERVVPAPPGVTRGVMGIWLPSPSEIIDGPCGDGHRDREPLLLTLAAAVLSACALDMNGTGIPLDESKSKAPTDAGATLADAGATRDAPVVNATADAAPDVAQPPPNSDAPPAVCHSAAHVGYRGNSLGLPGIGATGDLHADGGLLPDRRRRVHGSSGAIGVRRLRLHLRLPAALHASGRDVLSRNGRRDAPVGAPMRPFEKVKEKFIVWRLRRRRPPYGCAHGFYIPCQQCPPAIRRAYNRKPESFPIEVRDSVTMRVIGNEGAQTGYAYGAERRARDLAFCFLRLPRAGK